LVLIWSYVFILLMVQYVLNFMTSMARRQCARRAIVEAKQRSQGPVRGWVTKIYYLELLRASEMLSR
jgi:hypothetical protein